MKSPHHTHTWPITIAITIATLMAYLFTLAHMQLDAQNRVSLFPFWVTYASLWFMLSIMAWQLISKKYNPNPIPKRITIAIIFTLALITRITIVFTAAPTLSDDIYRYVHDGAVTARGENTYLIAPADHPDPPTPYTNRINNPRLPTIYLPASQYSFAALWQLAPPAHEITTFRLGFVLFDLIIIALLISALHIRKHNVWWAALYAWHPLPLIEIAGSGHQDTLGIACLLAALLCWQRGHAASNTKRLIAVGLFLALAASVKPVILPILIPLAWTQRKNPRNFLLIILTMLITTTALFAYFLTQNQGMRPLVDTLRTFAHHWSFNGPIHTITRQLVGHVAATAILAGLVILILLAWLIRQSKIKNNLTESFIAAWLVGALLVSSTVHPWYLLWSLALLPLVMATTRNPPPTIHALGIWIFSATIAIAYAPWHNPAYWIMPPALLALEFLPVWGLPLVLTYPFKKTQAPSPQ